MALKLTQSHKNLLVYIVAIIAFIIALVLIYLQVVNLRNLREEIEAEEISLEAAIDLLNRRLEHKRNEAEYEIKYEKLSRLIPDLPQEEEILRYFAYLEEEYDLIVSNISFGGRTTNQEEGYIRMPLSITIEGRYRNLIELFDHLHRGGERAIRIDAISLTVASADTVQLRVSLTANAFHRAGEQQD